MASPFDKDKRKIPGMNPGGVSGKSSSSSGASAGAGADYSVSKYGSSSSSSGSSSSSFGSGSGLSSVLRQISESKNKKGDGRNSLKSGGGNVGRGRASRGYGGMGGGGKESSSNYSQELMSTTNAQKPALENQIRRQRATNTDTDRANAVPIEALWGTGGDPDYRKLGYGSEAFAKHVMTRTNNGTTESRLALNTTGIIFEADEPVLLLNNGNSQWNNKRVEASAGAGNLPIDTEEPPGC